MSSKVIYLNVNSDQDQDSQDVDLDFKLPESLSMAEVSQRLRELRINFTKPTNLQIKVGFVSYYPTTGSVVADGNKKFSRKGFDSFLEVLRSQKLIK